MNEISQLLDDRNVVSIVSHPSNSYDTNRCIAVIPAMRTKTSQHLRELKRLEEEAQAKRRLRDLIDEDLASGPGHALAPQRAAQLKQQALGERC